MVDGADFVTSKGFLCVPTLFTSVSDITVTVFDIFRSVFKFLVGLTMVGSRDGDVRESMPQE